MNDVQLKILENYRIIYNEKRRTFHLHKAWPKEGEESEVISEVTEKALIATLLDLNKEEQE